MKTVILLLLIISVGLYIYMNKTKSSICTRGLEILHHLESPYQTIDLAKDKKTSHIAMFLNGEIQNHTKEYEKSHYAMVDVSIKLLHTTPKNILILGGGDGYPAMRALKQPSDVYIKNVEIDHVLINFVKTNPIMRKLTQDAFNDPRLDLTAMDAYKYIHEEKKKFDLIVHDLARQTNNTVTNFQPHDDYILENLLTGDGVLNYTQCLYDDIPGFAKVYNKYKKLQQNYIGKHFLLLVKTKEEFDLFSKHCMMDIKKLKEKYPNSEIGISIYDLKCRCGDYRYAEEVYFYISKQPFNKTNEDIEFHPFHNLTSGIP
jgi:spermidine synthase